MKILNKILNKNKQKSETDIETKSVSDIDILYEFEGVHSLQFLFTYDDIQKTHVYKLNSDTPCLYAKISLSPIFNSYTIQLFTYIGDESLNKDNINKVKIGELKLQYTLSPTDIEVLCKNNQYGFTYEVLINKLIKQYFSKLRTRLF